MPRRLSTFSSASGGSYRASNLRRQSMVKVEYFDITFDNPDAVYYAGEDVCGTIVLVLKDEKKVNEILLELKGKAKTYWTKHSGKSRQHYSDSEPYFCEQFNTEFTHKYGKHSERMLPAGRHEISFNYRLPPNLPSSFESEFGHVRYTCTARLEMPWDFDVICARAFTVVGVEDCNEERDAREPVHIMNDEIDVVRCWRKVGAVSVDLSLPKAGYVPGEIIQISAIIRNNSSRQAKYAIARLMMHTQYRAKSFLGTQETKQVSGKIASQEKGPIAPHGVQKWVQVTIAVPPVPPRLVRCKVIDIYYSLEFEVDPGLLVIVPLYIGNVPVVNLAAVHPGGASPCDGDITIVPEEPPTATTVQNPIAQKYPSLPLPTYEESMFGKYNIKERHDEATHGDTLFAPRYPCYKLK